MKNKLEVTDNFVYDGVVFDEGGDSHLATTIRAEDGINFIDLADHLGPAFGGHTSIRIFNDWHMKGIGSGLAHLSPAGVGV